MKRIDQIVGQLGSAAAELLDFRCQGIPKERIRVPAPDQVSAMFGASDRPAQVLVNLRLAHAHLGFEVPLTQAL